MNIFDAVSKNQAPYQVVLAWMLLAFTAGLGFDGRILLQRTKSFVFGEKLQSLPSQNFASGGSSAMSATYSSVEAEEEEGDSREALNIDNSAPTTESRNGVVRKNGSFGLEQSNKPGSTTDGDLEIWKIFATFDVPPTTTRLTSKGQPETTLSTAFLETLGALSAYWTRKSRSKRRIILISTSRATVRQRRGRSGHSSTLQYFGSCAGRK